LFSIELKNGYPKTSFWQFFSNAKNFNIESFWKQSIRDAVKSNKRPMLIYRKKGRKPIIGVTRSISKLLLNEYQELLYVGRLTLDFKASDGYATLPLVLYDFEKFLSIVKPDKIRQIGERDGKN